MGIHEGHRKRMKEEFLKGDLDNMPPHRVLELLLFYAIPQRDTNELAHRLLERFGSLADVLEAPYEDLMRVKGVGEHTAVLIRFISGLTRRYYTERAVTADPGEEPMKVIGQRMVASYIGRNEERLTLVCLDHRLRVLFFDTVMVGVSDSVQVQFRTLVKIAMECNAPNVILGHNHPHGIAIPSEADKRLTLELVRMFRDLDITLLDHFIVAGGCYTSMAEMGILRRAQ